MAGDLGSQRFNKSGKMPKSNCTNRYGQRVILSSFARFMFEQNSKKGGNGIGKSLR